MKIVRRKSTVDSKGNKNQLKEMLDFQELQSKMLDSLNSKKRFLESCCVVLAGIFLINLIFSDNFYLLIFEVLVAGKLYFDIRKISNKISFESFALFLTRDIIKNLKNPNYIPDYLK